MTPSNPSNGNPNILEIEDSNGVKHQVAAVNHTHTEGEVNNLSTALAAKMPKVTNHTTGNFPKQKADGTLEDSGKGPNDFMPMMTVDSTPTESSQNLVTSGGVKTALDGKQNTLTFDQTPTANSTNPVTSGGVKTALDGKANSTHYHRPPQIYGMLPEFIDFGGTAIELDTTCSNTNGMQRVIVFNKSDNSTTMEEMFESGSKYPIHPNSNGKVAIHQGQYAIITIFRYKKTLYTGDVHEHDECYFLTLDGIFDEAITE